MFFMWKMSVINEKGLWLKIYIRVDFKPATLQGKVVGLP